MIDEKVITPAMVSPRSFPTLNGVAAVAPDFLAREVKICYDARSEGRRFGLQFEGKGYCTRPDLECPFQERGEAGLPLCNYRPSLLVEYLSRHQMS